MVQFASYLRRVLRKTRLIFPRKNGPNVRGINKRQAEMCQGQPLYKGLIRAVEISHKLQTLQTGTRTTGLSPTRLQQSSHRRRKILVEGIGNPIFI